MLPQTKKVIPLFDAVVNDMLTKNFRVELQVPVQVFFFSRMLD
jgi:hypothetical protein